MDCRGAGPVPDGRGGPHVFVADLDSPRFDEDDYHHLARVLRLRDGAPMTIGDGRGAWRLARFRLDLGVGPEPDGEVVEVVAPERQVAVGFSLIKGGRPELVVQKLTELGVDRILPLAAERSVVRWDNAKAQANLERFRRVAREAAMQARRVHLPEVDSVSPPGDVADGPGVAVAEPGSEPLGGPDTAPVHVVLIGPEGGWTDDELAGRRTVGLGSTVLRAETAAIAAGTLLVALRAGRLSLGS